MKSFLVALVLLLSLFGNVSAGTGPYICHATGNAGYIINQPSSSGDAHGHIGQHHQGGRDIVPPFTYEGQEYSQNWDAEGQAIYNNGCVVVQPTEVPTEVPPTAVPTNVPTDVPTTVPTEVVTPEPTAEPTSVPTETVVTTPEPTAESTPVPTQASTPQPTVEQTPEATPTVIGLPNTGAGQASSGVPLYAVLGVAALILTTIAMGVRKRA